MPQTAVAPNVHQALDVHRDFAAQVTLDPHLLVHNLAKAIDLVVCQITHASVRTYIRPLEKLLAGMEPNAKDVRQRRLDPLIARKIDSCNSRHVASPFGPRGRGRLALPLLVSWVDTDHPNHALAPDDLALLATASH
jgi:hypothetical protein